MTTLVKQELQNITEKIAQEYCPNKIILFGSYAWGDPSIDSDFDLLIIKDTQESRRERIKKIQQLLSPRKYPVDLLILTPKELETKIKRDRNLFLEDIITNGKVLYVNE